MYDLDWLIAEYRAKKKLKYLYFWGVGLAKDDEKIANPLNWNGLNLLGFALMVVRDKILSE